MADLKSASTAARRADLVVLDGDPRADISAFRSIRWTIKGGDARTPEEWMAA